MRIRRPERAPTSIAQSEFVVDVNDSGDETVLTLHGELDPWTQQTLIAALARVEDSVSRIVLDLVDLTYIDAGNIGLIHRSRLLAALRGVELVLRSPNPHVQRIFEVTGLCGAATTDDGVRPIVLPLPSWAHDRPNTRS